MAGWADKFFDWDKQLVDVKAAEQRASDAQPGQLEKLHRQCDHQLRHLLAAAGMPDFHAPGAPGYGLGRVKMEGRGEQTLITLINDTLPGSLFFQKTKELVAALNSAGPAVETSKREVDGHDALVIVLPETGPRKLSERFDRAFLTAQETARTNYAAAERSNGRG